MKYVFRVLSSNIKNNVYTLKSGAQYYQIPLVRVKNGTERPSYIAVPKEKTYKKGDNLYVVLDTEERYRDIFTLNADPINDNEALELINKDFINYIIDRNYNHNLPHIVNNLMPVGIQTTTIDGNKETDKWSKTVLSIFEKYGKKLIAINPITTNKLYPFHYTKFLDHKFIREYRSNIIMFTLTYDKNYKYKENKITYLKDDYSIPMYEMISEEQFYDICDKKDIANNSTKPFLRSFNDHGLAKEVIQFMQEDVIVNKSIMELYSKIREEMKLFNIKSTTKDKKKIYFIPSLNSYHAVKIQHNKNLNLQISESDEEYLKTALDDRMKLLVKLYDENKIFYFTDEDLIIEDGKLIINSALKRIIDCNIEDLVFNKETKTLYQIKDYNFKDVYIPILEVVDKDKIKQLKDEIHNMWIEEKKRKSRTI